MNNDKIGVIVPVYKTEKYVAECIESILAQTYTNFRLILVDDGTPDNAGKICDEYAKKDNRITVIHQENAGVTRARAAGVEAANDCEWITFVDSDDTITHDALETLLSAVNGKTDIVISPADNFLEDCNNIYEWRKLLLRDVSLCNSPWGKLFKKGLFNKNTFDIPKNIKMGEDLLMNVRIAFTANDITIIPKNIYNYRTHTQNITKLYNRTTESETLFYEHLKKSVPDKEWDKYLVYTINTRLERFRNFTYYKYNANDFFNTNWYLNLYQDIKKSKYKMSLLELFLFRCNNCILRFIIFNMIKVFNTLQASS